jgi:hypothetical protein
LLLLAITLTGLITGKPGHSRQASEVAAPDGARYVSDDTAGGFYRWAP